MFFIFLMGLSLFCGSPEVFAGEGRWEDPWAKDVDPGAGRKESPPSAAALAAERSLRFYQRFISPVDGHRCPSYPTCSHYAIQAVRKHGALVGLVMTFDRLIHEADEVRRAPSIPTYGQKRSYDPVEHNDFWWDKKNRG